jgi:hypothetical protein
MKAYGSIRLFLRWFCCGGVLLSASEVVAGTLSIMARTGPDNTVQSEIGLPSGSSSFDNWTGSGDYALLRTYVPAGHYTFTTRSSSNGNLTTSPTSFDWDGSTTSFFVTFGGWTDPSQWCFKTRVVNDAAYPQGFAMQPTSMGCPQEILYRLQPGEAIDLVYCGPKTALTVYRQSSSFVDWGQGEFVSSTDCDVVRSISQTEPQGWVPESPSTLPKYTNSVPGWVDQDTKSQTNRTIAFGTTTNNPAQDGTLQTGFSSINQRLAVDLSAVNAQLAAHSGKLDKLDTDLNSGFVNVAGKLVDVKTAVNAVKTSVDSAGTTLTSINGGITDLGFDLVGVNSNLARLYAKDLSITNMPDSAAELGILTNVFQAIERGNVVSTNQLDALVRLGLTETNISEGIFRLIPSIDGISNRIAVLVGIQEAQTQFQSNALTALKSLGTVSSNQLDGLLPELRKHTDFLGQIATNTSPGVTNLSDLTNAISARVNAQQSLGLQAANADLTVDSMDKGAFMAQFSGSANLPSAPSPSIYVTTIGGVSVDLNPMHLTEFAQVAAWFRKLVAWFAAFAFAIAAYSIVYQAILSMGSWRQAQASGEAVLGTNVNTGVALVCAGLITVALAGVPAIWSNWWSDQGFSSVFSSAPWMSDVDAISGGVNMINQWIPLASIMTYLTTYFSFYLGAGAAVRFVQTVIRFLVG